MRVAYGMSSFNIIASEFDLKKKNNNLFFQQKKLPGCAQLLILYLQFSKLCGAFDLLCATFIICA